MSNHSAPDDPKKFVLNTFIAFVIVFVFAILMMLWHGDYEHSNGEFHYNTRVMEP